MDKDTIYMVTWGLIVEQDLLDCDAHLWHEAITSPMESLNSHRVFRGIEKITGKIIPTKFVLLRKLNEKGKLERYKARLVAQGFFPRPGFDFDVESTYALTVDLTVLWLLLTIAESEKLKICQCDVKTAYLEVELDPPVVEQLPKGLTIGDDENACFSHSPIAGKGSVMVQLVKALSGLRDSASAGHATIDKRLTSIRMHRCAEASAVYSCGNDPSQVFLTTWIDYLTIFR